MNMLHESLEALGYQQVGTGGNIYAYEYDCDNEYRILVTDKDDPDLPK